MDKQIKVILFKRNLQKHCQKVTANPTVLTFWLKVSMKGFIIL